MNTSTNIKGAIFSFLRVLAVALASAILPFLTAPQSDEVPTRAIVTALASAFLLTVINYFRPGDGRFGPEPKFHDDDHGRVDTGMVATIAIGIVVAVAILYILRLAF